MTRLLICFCAIALLVPTAASAGPRLGFEAGGSLVWTEYGYAFENDDFVNLKPRLEFNAAVTGQFDFSPTWGLITGLRYSRLGQEEEFNGRTANEPYDNTQSITSTTRQQYLGVPVLARLNFSDDRGPYLFGGTEVAWLIQATRENSLDDDVQDITDGVKRYNVAAIIGAGIELGFAGHSLEIGLRFGYGLVDIVEDRELQDPQIGVHIKRKTRELALTVGFRL